ncbi:MAG: sensor domain-containing protein [Candidatus Cloacimonetes bacterium]|jgi:hypothetical protein|nr:sensor domain-containing protein [Candidatus Cloacimonadota bacterium]MBT4332855.1 sensor domain-containing protein [Candidatus Cloacimonadota bacterium]MBT4575585.1 sensor domain-containing protein [Candidatus Cloacimonadota bacterium]MBT5420226.1 sensor domain-containing protein [Candidatus Cloacimonadota bacterium]
MYKTIDEFLSVIKQELKGSDKALIQDVLSDAEEHIRTSMENALNAEEKISEEDALEQAIESYGDHSEIIAEYKKMDDYLKPILAPSVEVDERPWWKKFLLVIADPRAWGASLYMVISMLTGIIYFTWAITGLSTIIPLLIFIIGIPLAGFFLLSVRGIALLEGRIVELMLGIRMPRKSMFVANDKGWWGKFKALISSGITWKTLIYMILQMPLGIVYFTLVVTLFSVSISLVAAPILELIFHLPMEINGTDAYTHKWLLPLLPFVGTLLLLISLHFVKLIGKLHGMFAKLMLVK